ncbi:hypothetical protein [Heyndrickxia coagulans]|uniref:hypothetical protein n=1 Tax=Heyndrickxia coagulans TaxID=1398 RepID=UPI001A948594|nr:hypothetical protein [Heyndrickxia coagulans]
MSEQILKLVILIYYLFLSLKSYGVFVNSNEGLKRTGIEKSYKGTTTGVSDIIIKPVR